MVGSIRWNFILGFIGCSFTFLLSISHNIFITALLQSLYSFGIMFLICFVFRWFLGTIVGLNRIHLEEQPTEATEQRDTGKMVNMATPDEDDSLHELLRENLKGEESTFEPLNPPKLRSQQNIEADEIAKVIRHMSDE